MYPHTPPGRKGQHWPSPAWLTDQSPHTAQEGRRPLLARAAVSVFISGCFYSLGFSFGWFHSGSTSAQTRQTYYVDDRPKEPMDEVRWIDTDVMVADLLTTVMESTKLVDCITTNYLNIEQPIDSVIKQRAKQLQRRKIAVPAEPLQETD